MDTCIVSAFLFWFYAALGKEPWALHMLGKSPVLVRQPTSGRQVVLIFPPSCSRKQIPSFLLLLFIVLCLSASPHSAPWRAGFWWVLGADIIWWDMHLFSCHDCFLSLWSLQLWKSDDFGQTWIMIQEHVKSFSW